jgi:hypothetical protein
MARILILGGEDRGVRLARRLLAEGHAVRVASGETDRREQIEAAGAEHLLGTPARLATLSGALEHVTLACWLFAAGPLAPQAMAELHGSRLEQFLTSAVDSTLRGFLYEAGRTALEPAIRERGERIVAQASVRNAIPTLTLRADPGQQEAWLAEAVTAVDRLLGPD